jgi:hypothetical protein
LGVWTTGEHDAQFGSRTRHQPRASGIRRLHLRHDRL